MIFSCRYLERSPEIMRLSVSRTLPDTRRSSRRMLSSSGDAPSAISSSEMMAVVIDSSRSRLPESRPKIGVSVVLVSCSASYSRARRAVCSRLAHRQQLARVERAAAIRAGQDRAYLFGCRQRQDCPDEPSGPSRPWSAAATARPARGRPADEVHGISPLPPGMPPVPASFSSIS